MTFNHILSQSGILKTFSVARRVSEDDIKKLTNQYNRLGGKKIGLTEFLKEEIIKSTQKAFSKNEVPGLIFDSVPEDPASHQTMMELTQFSSFVAKKMVDKKLSKFYFCFVVNALINMLGLTDKDFDEFHQKFSKLRGESDDDE